MLSARRNRTYARVVLSDLLRQSVPINMRHSRCLASLIWPHLLRLILDGVLVILILGLRLDDLLGPAPLRLGLRLRRSLGLAAALGRGCRLGRRLGRRLAALRRRLHLSRHTFN